MKKIGFLYLCVLVFFMPGCKKGEDDPAISLSSRKARLEGNWKLEKGIITIGVKDPKGSYSGLIYELDGDNSHWKNTSTGASFKSKGDLSISFTKNGDFSMSQKFDNESVESSGKWDFQGKVGKNKNKESFIIHLTSMKGKSDLEYFFNKGMFDFSYRIRELRKKS